jgi:hypothetical protein
MATCDKKRKMSYLKKNMKFGIEVPTLVDHALKIDKCNGNILWRDAIAKEIKDVHIAFKCLNPGKRVPLDYKWINSLTVKFVPAGTKLILFGRYVLNIYVGIV